jgi:hypothetical protein
LWTICLGWSQTMIIPISASQVVRILSLSLSLSLSPLVM